MMCRGIHARSILPGFPMVPPLSPASALGRDAMTSRPPFPAGRTGRADRPWSAAVERAAQPYLNAVAAKPRPYPIPPPTTCIDGFAYDVLPTANR